MKKGGTQISHNPKGVIKTYQHFILKNVYCKKNKKLFIQKIIKMTEDLNGCSFFHMEVKVAASKRCVVVQYLQECLFFAFSHSEKFV